MFSHKITQQNPEDKQKLNTEQRDAFNTNMKSR